MICIRNNNIFLQTLLSSKNPPFAAITALQTFGVLAVIIIMLRQSWEISPTLLEALSTSWIAWMGTSYVPNGQDAPTTAQRRLDLVTALATPLQIEYQLPASSLNSSCTIWRCALGHSPVVG